MWELGPVAVVRRDAQGVSSTRRSDGLRDVGLHVIDPLDDVRDRDQRLGLLAPARGQSLRARRADQQRDRARTGARRRALGALPARRAARRTGGVAEGSMTVRDTAHHRTEISSSGHESRGLGHADLVVVLTLTERRGGGTEMLLESSLAVRGLPAALGSSLARKPSRGLQCARSCPASAPQSTDPASRRLVGGRRSVEFCGVVGRPGRGTALHGSPDVGRVA